MARCDEVKRMKDLKLVYKESDFKKSSFGVQYLLDTLREVRDYVEETGALDDLILKRVAEVFGNEDEGIFQAMAIFRQMLIDNPEGLEPEALKEKHKRVVLECIATQEERLKGLASILAENEANEESAKTALSHLPSKDVVEKLLRYETTLERQIYRALNELERRQRQRRGESVPPPVSIEVSTTPS